jgi:hypothetical protein
MIEFKLIPLDKNLIFQVLKQDEDLRNLGDKPVTLIEHNGIFIRSCDQPDISCDRVYVRGRVKLKDFKATTIYFKSNTERDEFKKKVLEAFKMLKIFLDKAPTGTDTYKF